MIRFLAKRSFIKIDDEESKELYTRYYINNTERIIGVQGIKVKTSKWQNLKFVCYDDIINDVYKIMKKNLQK